MPTTRLGFATAGLVLALASCGEPSGPLLAPEPVILSISPDSVLVYSSAAQVTIHGTGFHPETVIFWDYTPKDNLLMSGGMATTFVSSTEVIVTVPGAYFTIPRTGYFEAVTPPPGGGRSEEVILHIVNPSP